MKINILESHFNEKENYFTSFLIEPLDIGQAITLGNSLRRSLLSDLTTYGLTGVRINNLTHEFAIIEGSREDVLEILLNLKEIKFKTSYLPTKFGKKFTAYLNVQGPLVVTASMFLLPPDFATILNPKQYICTITDDSNLYIELDIERGKGYTLIEEKAKNNIKERFYPTRPSTLLVDSLFMPVKKVNYKIKLIHDSRGNIKESLILEITTNGTITPKRALQEALKNLLDLFVTVMGSPDFLTISSEVAKKYFEKKKENLLEL
jgi:DNA-directed RNA polymerase subunit alpha